MAKQTRHERYLRNREREKQQALDRYYADAERINAARRRQYADNIDAEREKVRLRVRRYREKRRQRDTV